MNRPLRTLWGLTAAGAATAVGYTTRDGGLTAVTLIGGLALPRILGFGGHRHGRHGWGGPPWAGRGRPDFAGRGRSDFAGGRPDRAGRGHAHWEGKRAAMEERLAAWHRQAHGETAPEAPATPPTASGVPA